MSENGPFDIVVFDCDSTLSTLEGIDELARRAGVFDDCVTLTNASMDGDVPLEAVYAKRLDLIQPHATDLEWLGAHYCDHLTSGAEDCVKTLQDAGITVCVISGGLLPGVKALAEKLKISNENVYAVDIHFHENGTYRRFDHTSPLTRAGGKAEIINTLKKTGKKIACVGDGVTDLDMQMDGVRFIGFGGVVSREKVKKAAEIFVEEESLMAIIPYVNSN